MTTIPKDALRPLVRIARRTLAATALLAMSGTAVLAQGELNLYNWGEYINPEVLQRFEAETGIKVNLDTYNSNEEMLAKVQTGATGYDLVFPSVHMHDIMSHLDLLEPTNINRYEGFANIEPNYLLSHTDPNGEYCLPYAWGSVGIVYNREVLGKDIVGWRDLVETVAERGLKFTLLDDMREVVGVGLMLNGYSVNSVNPDELAQAAQSIIEMKPHVAAFTYDARPLVEAGDVAAGHFFVGAMIDVFREPEKLGYVIPIEGATMYQEDMCMLRTAPNKENAIKFMQFYTQPEIAALNIEQQTNGTPNYQARQLTPPHIRDSQEINPPQDVMDRLQIFVDVGQGIRQVDRIWTMIRTAQ